MIKFPILMECINGTIGDECSELAYGLIVLFLNRHEGCVVKTIGNWKIGETSAYFDSQNGNWTPLPIGQEIVLTLVNKE